jgi:hypothetical protein
MSHPSRRGQRVRAKRGPMINSAAAAQDEGMLSHRTSGWNTFAVVPYCKHLVIRQTLAYAAPIKMPTASTMAPPSTIWNTACRNGVSMYRARM